MKFLAEIKQTQQRKLASLDNEYKVVLVTSDPNVLDLGKLPPDVMVEVEIKKES